MADDDWEDAKARGRATRDAEATEAGRTAETKDRADERKRAAFAITSTSPLIDARGRVGWATGWVLSLGAPLMLLPTFRAWWWIALLVVVALVVPAVWLLGRREAPGRHQRELAWVASLPFPLDGYPLGLGWFNDHPRVRRGDALVRVVLVDAAGLDEAVDACRGLDPSLAIRIHHDALELRGSNVLVNTGANYRGVAWTHRVVDQVLRPLHAHRAIERVTFG
jgi:hypothetical protein